MDREEAISKLTYIQSQCDCDYYDCDECLRATNMAIEALGQPFDTTQLLDDGTLKIKVANVPDIKRIIVMDDNVIHTIQIN